ncbi:MAG: hypothetical protein MHM6MM_001084 [Cercozoa sp. M6MM]
MNGAEERLEEELRHEQHEISELRSELREEQAQIANEESELAWIGLFIGITGVLIAIVVVAACLRVFSRKQRRRRRRFLFFRGEPNESQRLQHISVVQPLSAQDRQRVRMVEQSSFGSSETESTVLEAQKLEELNEVVAMRTVNGVTEGAASGIVQM